MFERYTEKGRRVIFFARYEASQLGSPFIEPEHILLGILREDKGLSHRVISPTPDVVRTQIEGRAEIRPATSTSIDLPLIDAAKRVLAYAAEESERLSHSHVGPKHLLLGVLREERSFAAEVLRNCGLKIEGLREEAAKPEIAPRLSSSRLEVSVVTITSNPTGAEIELDGKFLGNTPAEVPLTAREWTIRITKAGFQPWERKLLVLPQAKQNVTVDLVKPE